MSLIVSIQLGRIRTYGRDDAANPQEKTWTTATFKEPVEGPVLLTAAGFVGDSVADRRFHGGVDKAALAYSHDHYAAWLNDGFVEPLPPGAFGENLLVAGYSEKDCCIGDIYELGEALVQVSQPRQPCWKQARRWGMRDLVVRMNKAGRTGWYLRVLREGRVAAGDHFNLRERPHPEWPVTRANEVFHFGKTDRTATAELAACGLLAASWRDELIERLG
ncbi:MAG: MOSC domain-containing protein [Acidobacteria bacterium]|nr:MOSC domain-containing protein [Acidobacteriota bacterium]